jgi:hypothetical protein
VAVTLHPDMQDPPDFPGLAAPADCPKCGSANPALVYHYSQRFILADDGSLYAEPETFDPPVTNPFGDFLVRWCRDCSYVLGPVRPEDNPRAAA